MRAWGIGIVIGACRLAASGSAGLEPLLCGGSCNREGRHVRGSSSLVSFLYAAAEQLIGDFDVALAQLEADTRAGRSDVKVQRRGGGGRTIHCIDWRIYAESAAFGATVARACRKKMPSRWKVRSSRPSRIPPSASS